MIFLNTRYSKYILSNLVWISGSSRSGTTLLANILASMKNVEYSIEPETLFSLFPLINKMNKQYWKTIFETYVVEDLFFNIYLGRKLNFKKKDDSYIKNYLDKNQLNKKINLNIRRRDFYEFIHKKNFSFLIKIPDIVNYLPKLNTYYKKNNLIIMKRNEASVVKSMVKKGWFVDEDKNIDSKFPMIVNSNKFFPYWLDKKFFKIWHTLNQTEKCYLCVYTMNLHSKKIRKKIEVRYEDLLENPNKEVNLLKKKLKLSSTNKTIKILSSIKNNKKEIYLKDLDIRAKLLDRFK